ncbi:hypothetical protein KDA_21650 [Dictyobacter alpinus]|uniref:Right handed beta helix domain-containing protein n=1 Tax=Dictyobacter alpinus TaxID=2014873 RepID=A0A402B5P6_9CHLR|nr:hypothetical protein [Dictyobacter alpinus]GCE26681.1 hypothetical protein KDA_21650 [Dictyobacter alpinus]
MIKYLWLKSKTFHLYVLFVALLSFLLAFGGSNISHAQQQTIIPVTICDQVHLQTAINSAAGLPPVVATSVPGKTPTVVNDLSAGDTIVFQCSGTIVLTGTLVINKNLTLDANGQNVTLDGNNKVQVLSIGDKAHVVLNTFTIAHGHAALNGGGLVNYGVVQINNSVFINNSAKYGGGIWNANMVDINNSSFTDNSATYGSGIYNDGGTVSLTNSAITSGPTQSASDGLLNNGGTVNTSDSNTFSDHNSRDSDTDSDVSDEPDVSPTATAIVNP